MCGLAGYFRWSGESSVDHDQSILAKVGSSILHRGPDQGGTYVDQRIALVHRRLSILDLSESGKQPMTSESGRYVIVFNGEIYNFKELRRELEKIGYTFVSQSDTEVLVALYEQYGADCLKKLNGMFAFAIWDKRSEELFIARDRLGKKPLYFYQAEGEFAFGSEIKALLNMPFVKKKLRADAVRDFFSYQYVPDPKTIFENLYKLPPGYWLLTDGKAIRKEQYWDMDFTPRVYQSLTSTKEQLYDLIADSVKIRMISDVPLGAFLSGGIDSSCIVGLMASQSKTPVTTCSIGFDSKKFDEVQYARRVAEQFNTDHHEFTVRENVTKEFKSIAAFFDEPFADPSFVPTYFVSRLARQRVTVALAGDGGDENFAGYEKYHVDSVENSLRRLFPTAVRRHLFPSFARILNNSRLTPFRKARSLLLALSKEPGPGFFDSNCFFSPEVWAFLVNPKFELGLNGYDPSTVTTDHYQNAPAEDHLSKVLYSDFKTYLPGDVLVKVDRMSMANSLETRAPLLDYRVVELAAGIPASMKLKGNEKKYVLKETFSGMLDNDILFRKKMGFSVPLANWLRTELRAVGESVFRGGGESLSKIFRLERVVELWERHLAGDNRFTQELWTILMFAIWSEHYEN